MRNLAAIQSMYYTDYLAGGDSGISENEVRKDKHYFQSMFLESIDKLALCTAWVNTNQLSDWC